MIDYKDKEMASHMKIEILDRYGVSKSWNEVHFSQADNTNLEYAMYLDKIFDLKGKMAYKSNELALATIPFTEDRILDLMDKKYTGKQNMQRKDGKSFSLAFHRKNELRSRLISIIRGSEALYSILRMDKAIRINRLGCVSFTYHIQEMTDF